MYIGWLRAGRLGALLTSIAFISPSFLMAVAIAAAYVKFGRLPWIQDLFYGIGDRERSARNPLRVWMLLSAKVPFRAAVWFATSMLAIKSA
jgi:hypothetical protein